MKKLFLLLLALVSMAAGISAQNYFTRDGKVKFDATNANSPENVDAITTTASCVLDVASGKMQWAVLIKSFHFEKALMQEHFNENYMESSKFPKATFSGQITNLQDINFSKDGTYNAVVSGEMTIHGITKDLSTNGALTVAGGKINLNAGFNVTLADYGISIPSMVSDKVGKTAKVLVDASLSPMK